MGFEDILAEHRRRRDKALGMGGRERLARQPVAVFNVPLAGGQAALRVIEGGPPSV